MTDATFWIVGRRMNEVNAGEWEFMGIFDAKEKAVTACSTALDFVASVALNVRQSDETTSFADDFYPLNPHETRQ